MGNAGRANVDAMRRRLKQAMERAKASDLADEVRADLAKYLCVRASGFVERSFVELAARFSDGKAAPAVARFVESRLERTTNLTGAKLVNALTEFDPAWGEQLQAFLDSDEEARCALDSVVGKRHRIAHGYDDGLSLRSMEEWFSAIDRVVAKLETILDPP